MRAFLRRLLQSLSQAEILRRRLGLLLVAALLPALAACATAPGTGRTIFTGGLTEEGEADLGRPGRLCRDLS